MGTFVVLAILVLVVFLIIRSMYKSKKAGKSLVCGCDCGKCGGACSADVKERRRQLHESRS